MLEHFTRSISKGRPARNGGGRPYYSPAASSGHRGIVSKKVINSSVSRRHSALLRFRSSRWERVISMASGLRWWGCGRSDFHPPGFRSPAAHFPWLTTLDLSNRLTEAIKKLYGVISGKNLHTAPLPPSLVNGLYKSSGVAATRAPPSKGKQVEASREVRAPQGRDGIWPAHAGPDPQGRPCGKEVTWRRQGCGTWCPPRCSCSARASRGGAWQPRG